jgi:hypothetical protein
MGLGVYVIKFLLWTCPQETNLITLTSLLASASALDSPVSSTNTTTMISSRALGLGPALRQAAVASKTCMFTKGSSAMRGLNTLSSS